MNQNTLTNGERADLIDAFAEAIESLESMIDSTLPPRRADDTRLDRENRDDWSGKVKRYRALRKRYLKEEKKAMPNKRRALRIA